MQTKNERKISQYQAAKLRREKRISLGQCARCGFDKGVSKTTLCEKCNARRKECLKNSSDESKAKMKENHKAYNRRKRQKSKEAGLCSRCFVNKAVHGQVHCLDCKDGAKKKRAEFKKNGLCTECGRKNDREEYCSCSSCASKIALPKQKKRWKALQYKGCKCVKCSKDVTFLNMPLFDFHHLDSKKKEAGVSSMLLLSDERFYEEVDKCIILCSNCHRMRHFLNNEEWESYEG